ncbi:MAG: WYL domain-containing protein [Paludibacteraceae bacterium]|nr:WYL domain-containing protein [Paludibacteraceae bacterium]
MTEHLTSNFAWLVNTLESGEYTLKEIQDRWVAQKRKGELTLRTFHRWRGAIKEIMGIEIVCTNTENGHVYKILRSSSNDPKHIASEFVINTLSLSGLIADSEEIHDKIILEPVPGGQQHLAAIVEAIKMRRTIVLSHRKFRSSEPENHQIHPLGLKMHKQRWYLLAYSVTRRAARVFALDRIEKLTITPFRFFDEKKKIGSIQEYFADCYGVFHEHRPTQIVIRTFGTTTNYLRTLPLHPSQEEIEPGIFQFYLRPEVDFISELLSHASGIEVLKPTSLRKQIKRELRNMLSHYKNPVPEMGDDKKQTETNPDNSGKQ